MRGASSAERLRRVSVRGSDAARTPRGGRPVAVEVQLAPHVVHDVLHDVALLQQLEQTVDPLVCCRAARAASRRKSAHQSP
mgnify:CR=1 FL=1